jgi:excisionase family DNA binding protein
MHNVVLSPIDPEKLISNISDRVTANILQAVNNNLQPTEQPDQLLTIEEAAKLLHLSKPTLYSKHSKGELPGVCKRGKRLYFSRQSLTDWIKQGIQKTNAEIEAEAEVYLSDTKKGLNNGK